MINAKNKRNRLIAAVSILALVILSVAGVVYAKYVFQKDYEDSLIKAESFYFTVDLLGDSNAPEKTTKEIHIYSGNKEVSFTVQNFFDSLRINQEDIQYTVSYTVISDDPSAPLSGVTLKRGTTPVTDDPITLTGVSAKEETYSLYIPNGYTNGDKIQVTVTSQTPYQKTMIMTFVLHTYEYELEYVLEDHVGSPYATLTLMTNVAIDAKKITVDCSAFNTTQYVLQVDTTNEYVLDPDSTLTTNNPGNGYLSQFKITSALKVRESISIKLLKTDMSMNYSIGRAGINHGNDGTYTIILEK